MTAQARVPDWLDGPVVDDVNGQSFPMHSFCYDHKGPPVASTQFALFFPTPTNPPV